jgi:hypothetical protein
MALFSMAHVRGDAFDLARSGIAEPGSNNRRRAASRHPARANVAAGRPERSGNVEFAKEKPLMLKLGLLAIALISAGLGLLALG